MSTFMIINCFKPKTEREEKRIYARNCKYITPSLLVITSRVVVAFIDDHFVLYLCQNFRTVYPVSFYDNTLCSIPALPLRRVCVLVCTYAKDLLHVFV